MTDREAYITLNMINGIGPARTARLIEFCGSPAEIFAAVPEDLTSIHGISASLAARICDPENKVLLEKELEFADRAGVRITTLADDDYPPQLRTIHDAPICLYVRGTIPEATARLSLAMVGTRNVTRYGADMARHLAESAAYSGWVTVSGLAIGIDTIVHRATLDAGGKTVGVLGGGLARFHPQDNIPLARDIIAKGGAVISEFPMNFTPTRHSFPMRNRIISGLTLGTLVVEAGINSGSLITAAHALEQGKRVFAVPGEASSANANGCNDLIRKGASLVENFEHILEDFEFLPGFDCKNDLALHEQDGEYNVENVDAVSDEGLSSMDQQILDLLQKEGKLTTEQLSLKLNLPPSDIMSSLIALEILKRIGKKSDGSVYRIR